MSQPKTPQKINIEALAEKVLRLLREDMRLSSHRSPTKHPLSIKRK